LHGELAQHIAERFGVIEIFFERFLQFFKRVRPTSMRDA
jgi:hypothetical protein